MATRSGVRWIPSVDPLLPTWIRRRYAAKYVVGFAVVLLVVGAIGGAIYVQTGAALGRATENRLQTESALQGDSLAHWVEGLEGGARTVGMAPAVRGGSPQTRVEYLQGALTDGTLDESVTAVHYLAGGAGAATTVRRGVDPTTTDSSGAPWGALDVGALSPGSPVMTKPYRSPATGRPALAVVERVDGSDADAVVLVVDLETAVEHLHQPDPQTSSVVVNDEGTVVLSHDVGDILGQNMGPADRKSVDSMAVKRGLAGETGYAEIRRGGQQVSMGYAPVEGTNWVVMVHEPSGAAFALQHDVSKGLLLLLGAALLGFVLIGMTLGKGTVDALETLADRAARLEAGDLDAELETDREDEIGALFRAFDAMRASLRETIDEAEAARARAEAERERAVELSDPLERKATEYREAMHAAAEGDLTRRVDSASQSEAMAAVGETVNAMIADLESTLGSVKRFSETVSDAAASMTSSAEEVRTAGADVGVAVQEISDGAEEQARSLQDVTGELEGLSATIEEIAASSQEVARTSLGTAERGEAGRSAAQEAIEGMHRIEARAAETAAAVERMNAELDDVGAVVDLIDGVAEQTSTLALNASIEAARAGDAGRGFAVVAEEVKRLAGETRAATTQIESQMAELGARAEQSADDVRRMQEGIASGTNSVEEAVGALTAIVDAVEQTNRGVQDIDDATDEQAASTQAVLSMVESVGAMGEQVNEESATVAAAAEEQAASLSAVTEDATSLAERAAELEDRLAAFEVGDDGTSSRRAEVAEGSARAGATGRAEADGGADAEREAGPKRGAGVVSPLDEGDGADAEDDMDEGDGRGVGGTTDDGGPTHSRFDWEPDRHD